jgi:hypothetical protein
MFAPPERSGQTSSIMEQELTPSESLKLIETMIGQAKQSFSRNSFYFLLWGVLLILAMGINYALAVKGDPRGAYAWGIMGIIGGVVSMVHGRREGRRTHVANAMDRLMIWIWMAFLATLLTTMLGGAVATGTMSVASILVLTGMPTFLSGQLMRFKPLIWGGVLFWLLGAVAYFVDQRTVVLLYIAGMLFGYLLPGYLLKRQEDGLRTA